MTSWTKMRKKKRKKIRRIDWENNPETRLCYSISEVARMYDLSEVTLRYWEQEGAFTPRRSAPGGNRYYHREQLEVIDKLNFLIYGQGFTLQAAKEHLRSPVLEERIQIYHRLRKLHNELRETAEMIAEILGEER